VQGRAFTADDAQALEPSVIVLSDGLWKSRYGGRADIVGSVIRLDGKPLTVIGVAPPDVKLPGESQFWEPLIFSPRDLAPDARGAQWVVVVARLQPGVDVRQANSALATVSTRLAGEFPRINQGRIALAMPLHQQMVRFVRPALLILLGAVSFVLLIACVNVANLLLARAQGRAHEVAVRTALGAGRQRLIRQFLAESLLLGGLGAAGGLAVAYWSIRLLVALGPASIPRLSNVRIDASVLLFTIAIGVGTSVLFGLVPALATTGRSTAGVAGSVGRGTIGSGSTGVRQTLVVCEMALAVILLVGAGLLVRSYQRLQQVNPGFDSEHVVTFNVSLPSAKYAQLTQIETFISTLIDRLRKQPGVVSAAGAFGLPFTNNFSAYSSFTRPGEVDSADAPTAAMRIVTPDYFKVMRIPVRAGRTFDARDDASGPEVVIVNEQAARRFWLGTNPIGQQIHLGVRLAPGVRSTMKTIVGIVGNVKYGGLDEDSPPEVYLPHAQHQVDSLTIVARTSGDPMLAAPLLRHEVAALDPDLPVADVQPMDQLIGSSIAQRRFTMLLLAAFAAVAVTLAAIGIYGVLSYVVSQRTQEIGVRLAIGASPVDVVRLFVREGVRLSAIGLTCGILGALAATRVLTTMLFGVTAKDPVTFGSVAAALIAVALVATYVPARRAAWVDPMRALRTD
jgi:putative ABC transport system permease protein